MASREGPTNPATHLMRLASAARQAAEEIAAEADVYAEWAGEVLAAGGRLLYCGNGGSAATAEHIAAEYVVRYRRDRDPLPAIALTTSSAVLTAAGNDFGFDDLFVRPLRALGRRGDLLIVHSTSGTSPNCLAAARLARELGLRVVALTGAEGGELAALADLAIRVPAADTATIQEIHLAVEHAVADAIDERFAAPGPR